MLQQPWLNLYPIILVVISPFLLAKSHPLAPALYVLGDSASDNGNNNWLPTPVRANFPPYGQNFPGPVVLGRFTNGRTCADFLAKYLGLPYPPAYASLFGPNGLNLSNPAPNIYVFQQNSLQGYNYASAAAGILPESGTNKGIHYTFDEQIDMFRQTVETQLSKIFKDPTQFSGHLSKSILFICIGSNDYLNNYFLPNSLSRIIYEPPQFAQHLIDVLSQQLQRLYYLGARKIVMTELGPIGCSPCGRMLLKPKGICDDAANNMLLLFNKKLPDLFSNLTSTLPGSYFILARTYSFAYDAIANPAKFGFNDSMNSCCTTWLNGTSICIPGLTPCPNPNDYFFWDGCHPTEIVNSLVTKEFFFGSFCSPMNLMQLARV